MKFVVADFSEVNATGIIQRIGITFMRPYRQREMLYWGISPFYDYFDKSVMTKLVSNQSNA